MTTETTTLEMQRSFDVPADRLYAAFTDPAQFAQWWGPPGTVNENVDIEASPGGRYSYEMRLPDAGGGTRVVAVHGEILEVGAHRLAYTYQADGDDRVTHVTALFEDGPEGSELLVQHQGLPTTEFADYNDGWNSALDRLDDLLAA